MKHVFLIDGSGFIFRAYYGLPHMTRADGTPTNAVFGFTNMVMKLIEDTDADHIAVVFDTKRKTFRNDLYSEYKANRDAPPDDLIPQFSLVREATRALGLEGVEMDGFEADDLIATYALLAEQKGAKVTIVSSDKDLMQLVTDNVTMFDAMKNKTIGPDQVLEKFGVLPNRVIDVQALAGDTSDNVPGVQGIGVKTAAQLINEYGDLDGVLENAPNIKQPKRREKLMEQADAARLSRDLVTLRQDVPIDVELSAFAVREPEPGPLLDFLNEQGFRKLVERVQNNAGLHLHSNVGGDGIPADVARAAPTAAPAVTDVDYELVQDIGALKTWIANAKAKGVVAVDTETTGLDAMAVKLVGVSLSIVPGHACYIPLAHVGAEAEAPTDLFGEATEPVEAPTQIAMSEALPLLKDLLEDPTVLKVGQNIKYDRQIFLHSDIDVSPIDDTMLLSFVLAGGLHKHGMDALSELHLGVTPVPIKEVIGTGKKQITFDKVELDVALKYAAEDADITLRLYEFLKPQLLHEKLVTVYETLERPLVPVLAQMERHGILVDAVELKRLSEDFAKRMADLEAEIHALAGEPFNVGSPKQLGEVLFDKLGLEGGKAGKTGAYATGADVLDKLAADGHELPQKVLDWRQLSKLKSTYTDALIAQINPDTGRVHTSYSMAATSTGRLASSDPNLQNIPIRTEEGRKIRRAFIPAEGHVLMCADYSQVELRLLAHVANIESLKQAFHDGQDIHALTASQVFGVPLEDMDPMVRRNAKAINFGIVYGISAFGLARQLDISRTEAKEYIEAYFAKYPGIRTYMDEAIQEAQINGYVTTLFGRRCHVRGINDKNGQSRGFAERAAINAPIQGGAADIIKRAMVRLPGRLIEAGLQAKILLQVHDELVLEVPHAEIDATKDVVRSVMEGAASLDVPLDVDIGVGDNWQEAH